MRILSTLAVLAALCAPIALTQTPTSAAHAAANACNGVTVNVRVSEITPEGSVAKFMAAVAANQTWYTAHGFKKNQIVVAQISVQDSTTKAWVFSDKKFITYHINPPTSRVVHDAAWDSFVKLYNETSKIVESYNTCMPETIISTDPAPWMKM